MTQSEFYCLIGFHDLPAYKQGIKVLPLAAFHIAHFYNQFNHVGTANFYATF